VSRNPGRKRCLRYINRRKLSIGMVGRPHAPPLERPPGLIQPPTYVSAAASDRRRTSLAQFHLHRRDERGACEGGSRGPRGRARLRRLGCKAFARGGARLCGHALPTSKTRSGSRLSGMGREGIEPSTLGLRVAFGASLPFGRSGDFRLGDWDHTCHRVRGGWCGFRRFVLPSLLPKPDRQTAWSVNPRLRSALVLIPGGDWRAYRRRTDGPIRRQDPRSTTSRRFRVHLAEQRSAWRLQPERRLRRRVHERVSRCGLDGCEADGRSGARPRLSSARRPALGWTGEDNHQPDPKQVPTFDPTGIWS
jgi:hypothetical protein